MNSRLFPFALLLVSGCSSGNVKVPDMSASALDMSIAAPTTLASATTLTNCLAADDNYVYWSDSGAGGIERVAIAGGMPSVIASGGDKNGCVAVDKSGVYYTDSSALMQVPIAGGSAVALTSSQDFLKGAPIVAAGGFVYWITDVYGNVDAYDGKNAIVRVATSGGNVDVVLANVVNNPGGLAVDGTNVYWSDFNGTFAAPLANPATTTPVTFGGAMGLHPFSFAVSSTSLVQAEVGGVGSGSIVVYRLDGTMRMVLSTSLSKVLGLDDKGAYVNANGALERLPLDGSGAQLLATQAPRALALSTTTIYFTDGASIYSLPR